MNEYGVMIYRTLRNKGWGVAQAARAAHTEAAWYDADGSTCYHSEKEDCVDCRDVAIRLVIVPDEICSIEDLEGDTYNPKANPDIPEERLKRERAEFAARIEREGVWGLIAQCRGTHGWETVDSCFGFVGEDWRGSGYDIDLKSAALETIEPTPSYWVAL